MTNEKGECASSLGDCSVKQTLQLGFTKNVAIPFYQWAFEKEVGGYLESALCADVGLKLEEWLATRVLKTLESKTFSRSKLGATCIRNNTTTTDFLYALICDDPESSIFQPTIMQPLQRTSNFADGGYRLFW
ncbi:hypothetical protein [Candidatus Agathobaculum pullicola]|uniref:hypothetical protein n=1 Tax=Candidatus Agathobaculum pullicola TaxID=2838426 RepID=UPI003F8E6C66